MESKMILYFPAREISQPLTVDGNVNGNLHSLHLNIQLFFIIPAVFLRNQKYDLKSSERHSTLFDFHLVRGARTVMCSWATQVVSSVSIQHQSPYCSASLLHPASCVEASPNVAALAVCPRGIPRGFVVLCSEAAGLCCNSFAPEHSAHLLICMQGVKMEGKFCSTDLREAE